MLYRCMLSADVARGIGSFHKPSPHCRQGVVFSTVFSSPPATLDFRPVVQLNKGWQELHRNKKTAQLTETTDATMIAGDVNSIVSVPSSALDPSTLPSSPNQAALIPPERR